MIVGTTGESPTVDVDEHCKLIERRSSTRRGRMPVIAGTGGNSTREAIELTQFAKKAGADYALSVVPYYNKPTQEGLYRHFKAIAEASGHPDHPLQRAGRTVADLAERDGAPPGPGAPHRRHQGSHRQHRARDRAHARVPRGFSVFSGDDATRRSRYMLLGGNGVISVTANVAPRLMHEMCAAARAGDAAKRAAPSTTSCSGCTRRSSSKRTRSR